MACIKLSFAQKFNAMEPVEKTKILNSIGVIYEKSKKAKLENSFLEALAPDLQTVSGYFKTTHKESFLIALVFALNYKGRTVDFNDLLQFIECNPIALLQFSEEFEALTQSEIFVLEKSHGHNGVGFRGEFFINNKITSALLRNQPMPEKIKDDINDIYALIKKAYEMFDGREEVNIPTFQFFVEFISLLKENSRFDLARKLLELDLGFEDITLFVCLLWKILNNNENLDLAKFAESLFEDSTHKMGYVQQMMQGQNPLLKNDYIELVEGGFFNDAEVKFTDKSIDFLKDCGITLLKPKNNSNNIIAPKDIPTQKMFYGEAEQKQFALINKLLQNKELVKTQKRLKLKGLPTGITMAFYGAPGTGKTEMAKQIAKVTGREIMKVEISQSKSMWFGESEKMIKRIFTDYKKMLKTSERTPILLFNEADAILSKRKNTQQNNVSQTENAIQNILLEEMENFEGILIATTNLIHQMDAAFERRFLFKVEFSKPDTTIKSKIWQSKILHLTHQEAYQLAEEYDFSGGQINNVVRKNEINQIIHRKKMNFNDIVQACKEETFVRTNKSTKIGFNLNTKSTYDNH